MYIITINRIIKHTRSYSRYDFFLSVSLNTISYKKICITRRDFFSRNVTYNNIREVVVTRLYNLRRTSTEITFSSPSYYKHYYCVQVGTLVLYRSLF